MRIMNLDIDSLHYVKRFVRLKLPSAIIRAYGKKWKIPCFTIFIISWFKYVKLWNPWLFPDKTLVSHETDAVLASISDWATRGSNKSVTNVLCIPPLASWLPEHTHINYG